MRTVAVVFLIAFAGCISSTPEPESPDPAVQLGITWLPELPLVGEPVTFHVDVSSNVPGDRIDSIAWEIGGIPYAGNNVEHRFHRDGQFDVLATVTTQETGTTSISDSVSVSAPNNQPAPTPAPTPEPIEPPVPGAPLVILLNQSVDTVAFSFSWSQAATQVHWDFGDGQNSQELQPVHTYDASGQYTVTLRAISDDELADATAVVSIEKPAKPAYVVVGVVDSGINPYHSIYYRPDLVAHPCTYIEDYPCNIPALELTVGPGPRNWNEAFQADADEWDKVGPGKWFWIPRTNLVAVGCDEPSGAGICILDDSSMHGTGTTSSVLYENPDALIAFGESGFVSGITMITDRNIPIDILSLSLGFGTAVGLGLPAAPLGFGLCDLLLTVPDEVIIVQSSGNEPGLSILADCWSGNPRMITVGGASAAQRGQETLAYKDMDVVSYFCRPTAQTQSLSAERASYCGTSFSTPTVAGALSKVILELRTASGHDGGSTSKYVDPILKVTKGELRDAMNLTASYSPTAQYNNGCGTPCIPLNPSAPWLQWGWGFYDGTVAEATTDYLLGAPTADKPLAAVTHQETLFAARQVLYG